MISTKLDQTVRRAIHVIMLAIVFMTTSFALPRLGSSQDDHPPPAKLRRAVMIEFHEDINPLSGAILLRRFQEALDADYDVVILDIHSPGGHTSVTFKLMDMLLTAKGTETVAWIETDAISGAALLSLAADKIIMRPSARIGDAGEIVLGDDGAFRYTEAKSRSVLAQKARDTAKAKGRPEVLAEKMTDKDMVVFTATHRTNGETRLFSDKEWQTLSDVDQWEPGKPIREGGKEMFFIANGERAVELGLADATAENRDELAKLLQVETPIPMMKRSGIDMLVLVLNSGFVTFLLLVVGMVALVIELSAAGFGLGGLVSILCFGLFFWSRFLGGTSGWLEVTLFVIGIVFIGVELLVLPGFGVAGLTGIALTLGSLVMASRRVLIPTSNEDLMSLGMDVLTVLGAFAGFLLALFTLSNYLGQIPGLSRLTLQPQSSGDVAQSELLIAPRTEMPTWQTVQVGDVGVSTSSLRPSGKIEVGGAIVDVVSEGEFIDPGTSVRIITKKGARIVVRKV